MLRKTITTLYPTIQISTLSWLCVSPSAVSDSFETLRAAAPQAPLAMEFSRQEYWSGWGAQALRQGDLPDPGSKPGSPALQADSLLSGVFSFNLRAPSKARVYCNRGHCMYSFVPCFTNGVFRSPAGEKAPFTSVSATVTPASAASGAGRAGAGPGRGAARRGVAYVAPPLQFPEAAAELAGWRS